MMVGMADQRKHSAAALPIVLFDGDCGFCTTSARWAERRVRPDAEFTPWQFVDLEALDDGRGLLTAERLGREVVLLTPSGAVYGGARAVARTLACGGGPWAVAGAVLRLPGVRSLAAVVYRTVASNRGRMPGGTAACALPPS
jgi:predicted DCC family thiol-disulfide oxidoreductase YuxK